MASTLDRFTLGKTLGSGFSAKVKVGTDEAGNQFALKIFQLDNPHFNERAFRLLKEEVEATVNLNHKHVVNYYEFKERAILHKKSGQQVEVAYIVQEMIPNGEFFDYVASHGCFDESICKYYFKQMLLGISYIHYRGFAHRDLKPENLLLDKDYDIKIVDFGFATSIEGRDGSGKNRTKVGTPGYMAPEILKGDPYMAQGVDLFALGVILFILRAGHPPFSIADDKDNFYKLLTQHRSDLFWKAHQNPSRNEEFFSPEFKDLITCLLQANPNHRPCIADIIGHPWMAEGIPTQAEVQEELSKRNEANKERAEQQRARKEAEKLRVKDSVHRAVKVGTKVYLSSETCPDQNIAEDEVLLTLKEYEENSRNLYTLFSTFKPEHLLQQLTKKLDDQGQKYTVSDKTWKVNFCVQRVLNEDAQFEAKEERNEIVEPILDMAEIQIEIKKVKNQQKYCLDFQRKSGSAILFYDNANKYFDLLELVNNTTLEEPLPVEVEDEMAQAQAQAQQ